MATFKYTIASGCDTGLMQKHSHSSLISDINNSAKNNMPRGAVISSARVVLVMSHNGGLGSADLNVWLCNNESDNSGENLISDSTNKNDDKTYQKDISSKITKNYPFTFNTSYSRIAVYYKSTTHRHYRDRDFYVEYTYSVPTYTVTVNAGTGGTVSGGGTYQNQATATLTATAKPGYNFVKWSDGNTSASRTVTVTGNATYTAEFQPIPIEVTVKSSGGVNGATATISGAGQYKFGDTITLKADAPPYHKVTGWMSFDYDGYYISEVNPATITLNEKFIEENATSLTIKITCYLEFTGYTVKAEIQPEEGGKVRWGFRVIADGNSYYFPQVDVTPEGVLIEEEYVNVFYIEAIPQEGYEFVQWLDGETTNPRMVSLTGDATFTAIFINTKTNNIYIGTVQPKAVYVGTQEVKGIYVGTTKVYG